MLQPLMTLPLKSTVLHDQQMEFVTYVRRVTKCTGKMDTPPRIGFSNSRIGGNVELVNGRADILAGTIVAGDLIVHKSKNSWGWGNKSKPPIVVIGAGSEIVGRILVENAEAKLYVHDSARVGAIEGVQATKYSGSSAPE